jgi:hypothetical protein
MGFDTRRVSTVVMSPRIKELDPLGPKMSALLGAQLNHDVAYIRVGHLVALDEGEQRSDHVALRRRRSSVNGCIRERFKAKTRENALALSTLPERLLQVWCTTMERMLDY